MVQVSQNVAVIPATAPARGCAAGQLFGGGSASVPGSLPVSVSIGASARTAPSDRDMARQWRELADHAEAIELRRPAVTRINLIW